ncbi:DcrB-related protein [Vagococcus sp. WN89Y]|uniref:DcrB-related protein n=1 Tax=Vagococcus sp. WN89Y TaxID=3457258 RepID=UPI003FCDD8B5
MSEPAQPCLFTEGQVTLPEGYQDRTVNVFTPPGADAPAFNISRDTLNPGETLAAYIDRQMALMAKHLKGWKTGERGESVLGDNLVTGEVIHASYLRDGKRAFQQQAVFNPSADRILVFTMSATRALGDADSVLLRSLLQSFRFHA